MRYWVMIVILASAAAAQDPAGMTAQAPAKAPAKVRLRWLKRLARAEPAFAERFSSWGIPDTKPPRPPGNHRGASAGYLAHRGGADTVPTCAGGQL